MRSSTLSRMCQSHIVMSFNGATDVSCPLHRYREFYPDGPEKSDSFARIGESHAQRIKNLLDNTKGKIVFGGEVDVAKKYVALILVRDMSGDDSLMSE